VGVLVWTALAPMDFARRAALVCVLSLFVSPYNYDYDLAILGIALGFVLPELAAKASGAAFAGLLALAWVTGGYGIVLNALEPGKTAGGLPGGAGVFAAAGVLLVTLCAATVWLLRTPGQGAPELASQQA
jgi:hypothetical protein